MFIKRMFPNRWAKVLTWTSAALAWGSATVAMAVANDTPPSEPADSTVTTLEPPTTTTSIGEVLPTQPPNGLVIIRYTPVPAPQPEVITRTVTVSGAAQTRTPAAPSQPAPKVKSKGS